MTLFPDLERQLQRAASQLPAQPHAGSAPRGDGTGGRPAWRRPGALRRLAPALAGSVLVGALVLVLSFAGGESPDLAARAYAATSGAGIVHWRTDLTSYANGRLGGRQRVEGWSLGSVTHILRSDVIHGKAHVTDDERDVGRRSRVWLSVSDDFVSGTRPARPPPTEMIPSGDPFAAFRRAFRAGKLRDLGGGRFEVRFRHLPSGTVVYAVDPKTGRPLRLVIRSDQPAMPGRPATRSLTVVRFSTYEKLPPNASNRSRLTLLPHPGAGPGREPASDSFAALRTGAAPTGAQGRQLQLMARNMSRFHIDASGIRAVTKDVWLMPGRGYVCVAISLGHGLVPALRASTGGLGAGCLTVRKAVRSGVSTGTPNGTTIAVPDGVVAIEARLHGHGSWRRFEVSDGLARLPGLGYQWRLVR